MENVIQKENNFIQLKKKDTLKIGIRDEYGNDTGEYLEFDFNDIELPLKINKASIDHEKNVKSCRMKFMAIDKKEDIKGKYAFSKNEEEKIKALQEFYQNEIEVLDKILGEGGTKKLLNGRKPYYEMFDDIAEILQTLEPLFEKSINSINDKIRNKYKNSIKEGNVLE